MDAFLDKHDIDVGRTFSVLIFAGMVQEIYSSIGALLGGPGIALNLGIIILFFLGVGMWRHQESSRRWCLFLLYFVIVGFVVMIAIQPFVDGVTFTIGGFEEKDPPFWKSIVFLVAGAPVLYILVSVLHSKRAIREFNTTVDRRAEQVEDAKPNNTPS